MPKAKARRPQQNKGRSGKVIKSGNPEYVQGMQNLRRSNVAAPHKAKTAYVRRDRNNNKLGD